MDRIAKGLRIESLDAEFRRRFWAQDIRSKRAAGQTTTSLAREYGVSHQLVSQIASGKSRKHSGKTLPGEER